MTQWRGGKVDEGMATQTVSTNPTVYCCYIFSMLQKILWCYKCNRATENSMVLQKFLILLFYDGAIPFRTDTIV